MLQRVAATCTAVVDVPQKKIHVTLWALVGHLHADVPTLYAGASVRGGKLWGVGLSCKRLNDRE